VPAASRRSPAEELGPKARRTVQSILDNARELFLDRGYASTSVEDITSAAGVSRATFWTYFATKQDVLRSLGENVEEEGLAIARNFADLPAGASLDEVTGWVRAYLQFLDTYGAFINAAFQAAYTDPELRQWQLDTETGGAEALGKGLLQLQGGKTSPGVDLAIQGLGILSMLERFWYQWRVGGLELDEDAVARSMAQLIWGAAQKPAATKPRSPRSGRRRAPAK
jgi:AcrR family transcriptional regulator